MLKFEWDIAKAEANLLKHGITFEEAATVFGDPLAITFDDPHNPAGENRLLTFGLTHKERLLLVVHTARGHKKRIISARKATKQERKIYEY
ncbi:MAG: BrnT family toxin [Methylococcaceae bacterium]|nr:BrnT family toxin [Methylococcaceae bacterium]